MLEPARSFNGNGDGPLAAPAAPSGALRLLVIDDDTLHRMVICRVAAKAGYLPAGAATYDEAAELTREVTFDCITLDMSLGSHTGMELLHHLRVIGSQTPIIVISGCDGVTCSETVQAAKSLDLNIWQSMPKPIDLALLRDWFERLKSGGETVAAAAA
jgi:DNA-binding response OmpR family regulator